MKKTVTLFFILSAFIQSFAQITMDSTNMPVASATSNQRMAKQTTPAPIVNFGNKGANQFYNFSNLTHQQYDTILYKVPITSQRTAFPGTDDAITLDNVNYLYSKTTASKYQILGLEGKLVAGGSVIQAPYSNPTDVYHFPTAYLTNFKDTTTLSKTVAGSDVGQSGVYQVRLTSTTISTDTTDGWGKITTPVGSYKCLRKKRKDVTTTLIEYSLCSICGFSTLAGYPTTTTTVRYSYPAKETKGSVVTFEYDSANNVTTASYSLIPPAAPIALFGNSNGSGGLVFFTDSTDGYPDTYSWTFGDGGTSNASNPNHTYSANGAYYVCETVNNAGGSTTYCDSVHVSGITGANHAPVAVTDTVSLLQATSIIIHVAANDVDPDGDHLCVDTVWGSPYVTLAVGGSCDLVSIHPDSTFVGTDTAYYRVCDNGTPVLCDTGTIIITVNANSALLPVADFTANNSGCLGVIAVNQSQNIDSIMWHFHTISGAGAPDMNSNQDSVEYAPGSYATIQVCLTAYNQFGNAQKCDTVNTTCEGISQITLSDISIYPNPASNIVTIDMRNNNDAITRNYAAIEIYNALGEKVKTVAQAAGKNTLVNIPVSEFAKGIYVATIVDSKGVRQTLGRFTKE